MTLNVTHVTNTPFSRVQDERVTFLQVANFDEKN